MLTSFKRSYKWSLLGLSIILLLGGSVLTNAKTPNARAAAGHPIDNVKPFAGMKYGPNHALVALENDYIGQIEKMNSEGEYMNEVAIIMNLHGMTHQKIKADRIGFSVKMTPEMIELMMENIKKAPNIEDRDNYLTIVKRWKAGDFTRIREDHDYLNKRQGGTIGFSIGVNSPEEEAVFVKKYFSDKIQSIQPDSDTRPVPGPISPGIQKDSVSIPAEQYQFMSSIYKSVGIRKLLSKDRQEAAVKEWLNGKDDLSDLEALPPQTTAELLLEIEKMYQGEKPFTEKRAKALAVIARNGLIKAEMDANKAIFPFPGGFTFKNDHPDTANASFRGSYEMFHQYIDKAIVPFVERISKQ